MPLRTRIFIIISVVVLIILAITISLFVFSKNRKNDSDTATTTINNITNNQLDPNSTIPASLLNGDGSVNTTKVSIEQPTTEDMQKNASKQIAKIFVERFGSYSTDSNYQNIIDVKSIVSDSLYTSLSSMISDSSTVQDYSGVTTKVIANNNISWSSTSAKYLLSTMRVSTKNLKSENSNQDIEVVVIKSNGNWVVDSYTWK